MLRPHLLSNIAAMSGVVFDVLADATTYLGGIAPTLWWDFVNNRAYFGGANYADITAVPGWSFTRVTTGYALNAAGVWTSFGSGVPRRTDRGLLIENALTNICLWSNDFTNAAWVKSNITATLDQTGPDGVASGASRLTATSANGTVLQSFTQASNTWAGYVWIKRITGSGNIDITLDGGTAWTTITVTGSFVAIPVGKTQSSLANPVFGLRIVTSGDEVAVWCAQFNSGLGMGSPIPTTTALTGHNTDAQTVTSPGITYPLSMWAEFERGPDSASTETIMQVDNNSATDRATMTINSSDLFSTTETSGNVSQASVSATGALTPGSTYKVAARFNTNSVQSCKAGTLSTEDTAGTLPATVTNLRFGAQSGASSKHGGYLKRLAFFDTALSDANLQTITT